jgi:predicted negative regulator of RcsB-dependent stress response
MALKMQAMGRGLVDLRMGRRVDRRRQELSRQDRIEAFVDNATKKQLKQPDQFVSFTEHGISWASHNRKQAIWIGVVAVALILAIVGGYSVYEHRSAAASTAFGAAMQTYQRPLNDGSQPLPPGTKSFPDAKARATAANAQFQAVANQYGMTEPGELSLYFAGVTALEEGNTSASEETLTKVSHSWNGDIAALGKMALAGVYEQTGRNAQAEALLQELGKGHATTVPPFLAQIQLGELYQSEGRSADAKRVWAQVKDKDKDAKGNPGPAGEIAEQKLNPQASPGLGLGQ